MPAGYPIGLITAASFEAAVILSRMEKKEETGPFTTGALAGRGVVHIAPGMGTANAAYGTTLLMERYRPRLVMLLGIGGAYPGGGLGIGELAVAEKEIYADLGVAGGGGRFSVEPTGMELLGKDGRRYFNEFPMDRALLKEAIGRIGGIRAGVFLTVSIITSTTRRARELQRLHNALCENMEGAAVAQTCARYGAPLLEMRGISNMVKERETARWDKALAAANCQEAAMELIKGAMGGMFTGMSAERR